LACKFANRDTDAARYQRRERVPATGSSFSDISRDGANGFGGGGFKTCFSSDIAHTPANPRAYLPQQVGFAYILHDIAKIASILYSGNRHNRHSGDLPRPGDRRSDGGNNICNVTYGILYRR
jgi:hypothetical protein